MREKSNLFIALQGLLLLGLGLSGCARTSSINDLSDSAIYNGHEVSQKDSLALSVVAIHLKRPGTNEGPMCTGTIVSDSLILTAAHCMIEPNVERTILFGVDGRMPISTRAIVRHIDHPEWLTTAAAYMTHPEERTIGDNVILLSRTWNDVAILEFDGGLPEGFKPAEILIDPTKIRAGTKLIAIGYGVSNPETGEGVGRLRTAKIAVNNPTFRDGEFSVEQADTGTCEGDSGGPVFVEDGDKVYVAGITSHGINDIQCRGTTVFTSVPEHRTWVSGVIEALKAD